MPEVRADDVMAQLQPDSRLLKSICRAYQICFYETPKAIEFFHRRGLTREGLFEHFQVGYADRKLARSLPPAQSKRGKELREKLMQLGLYRASGHGHFNGCLTFPIYSADGKLVELYGRKLGRNLAAGTAFHCYRCCEAPERSTAVFNHRSLGDQVVLTDSPINAMSVWSAGIDSVTCSTVPNASHVLLAYRNTDAGNQAADKMQVTLAKTVAHVGRITLPAGMDANDVLRKEGPERLQTLVHEALSRVVPLQTQAEEQPSDHGDGHLGDIVFRLDDRHYRVRGLEENTSPLRMKINLKVTRDKLFHVHLLDLYSAIQRRSFIKDAANELFVPEDLIKRDLGTVLSRLEAKQEQMLRELLQPQEPAPIVLTEPQRADALELLEDPRLIDRIGDDFERCGLVGEATNKTLCYLAATSRLLQSPLSVLIQSSSAAGKTTLMDRTLAFMPPEAQTRYSAMTSQSLYYLGRNDLRHKLLAIAEEEGVTQASYALKLLQSEGRLQIATAGKDEQTGRQQTQLYSVEGPVAMLLTTTCEHPDEELANRCLVIHVNESAEQTAAIQREQRRAFSGLNERDDEKILERHQNAQRLLEPYPVIIPGVEELTFRSDQPRMRRDHAKYLTLIATIALLHQYQRKKKELSDGSVHLMATEADVKLADRLMSQAMQQSLGDLLPRTRELLGLLTKYLEPTRESERTLTQREMRETFGWGDFALRRHLKRLVELEYVLVLRGPGNQRRYKLVSSTSASESPPDLANPTSV